MTKSWQIESDKSIPNVKFLPIAPEELGDKENLSPPQPLKQQHNNTGSTATFLLCFFSQTDKQLHNANGRAQAVCGNLKLSELRAVTSD